MFGMFGPSTLAFWAGPYVTGPPAGWGRPPLDPVPSLSSLCRTRSASYSGEGKLAQVLELAAACCCPGCCCICSAACCWPLGPNSSGPCGLSGASSSAPRRRLTGRLSVAMPPPTIGAGRWPVPILGGWVGGGVEGVEEAQVVACSWALGWSCGRENGVPTAHTHLPTSTPRGPLRHGTHTRTTPQPLSATMLNKTTQTPTSSRPPKHHCQTHAKARTHTAYSPTPCNAPACAVP